MDAVRDAAGSNPDEVATLILGVPAVYVGTALLLLAIGVVCAVVAVNARRSSVVVDDGLPGGPVRVVTDDRRLLVVALTVLAIAFFVLPTRVHERYLFPFFAIGAILAATSIALAGRLRRPVAGELRQPLRDPAHTVLRQPGDQGLAGHRPTRSARRSGSPSSSSPMSPSSPGSSASCGRRPSGGSRSRRWRGPSGSGSTTAQRPAGRARLPSCPPGATWRPAPRPRGSPARRVRRRRLGRSGIGHGRGDRREPGGRAGSSGLPLPFGLGAVRTFLADRSRRLHGEGGGRFDRLDLWLLVVHRRRRPRDPDVPARRSRTGCTSTRSTTPGPRPSSSRTGATASPTTSTSTPIPISRSTRWRSG